MSSNPNGSPISADVNGRAKCENANEAVLDAVVSAEPHCPDSGVWSSGEGGQQAELKGPNAKAKGPVQPVQRHAARRCHSVIMRA